MSEAVDGWIHEVSTMKLRRTLPDRCRRNDLVGWLGAVIASIACFGAGGLQAADLSSAHYRHRAGSFGAIGVGPLTSGASQPLYSGSGVSLGAISETDPFGRLDSLRSVLPGFFWIQAGRSFSLDLDSDGVAYFLDEDDDGDGLLDVHETGTGSYVSPQNTGTSAVLADTDGDGYSDGFEVAGGTDPTNPASRPGSPSVPALPKLARLLLVVALIAAGLASFPPRCWRST